MVSFEYRIYRKLQLSWCTRRKDPTVQQRTSGDFRSQKTATLTDVKFGRDSCQVVGGLALQAGRIGRRAISEVQGPSVGRRLGALRPEVWVFEKGFAISIGREPR